MWMCLVMRGDRIVASLDTGQTYRYGIGLKETCGRYFGLEGLDGALGMKSHTA